MMREIFSSDLSFKVKILNIKKVEQGSCCVEYLEFHDEIEKLLAPASSSWNQLEVQKLAKISD